jgi:hypothetical protein
MSVQALSPYSGSKRLFGEDPEDIDSPCDRGQGKRSRFLSGSPSGRCSGSSSSFQAVHPATLEALKGLFPGMDDQVRWKISSVQGLVQQGVSEGCGMRRGRTRCTVTGLVGAHALAKHLAVLNRQPFLIMQRLDP